MQSKVGYANDPVGKILRFLGAADLTTASITLGGGGRKGCFLLLASRLQGKPNSSLDEPKGEGRERDCGQ